MDTAELRARPISAEKKNIRTDPVMVQLLRHIPQDLAQSYNDEQLEGIKTILGDRVWNKHSVDSRGTFSLPFIKWRFYYVFLLGKNKRAFTRREKQISMGAVLTLLTSGLFISLLLGFIMLYILKSALGIDLLPESSMGLWEWLSSG